MSLTIEQRVRELQDDLNAVANIITSLSSKLSDTSIKLSIPYYISRWIPCKEQLPYFNKQQTYVDCYLVTDGQFIWMAYYVEDKWVFTENTNSNIKIDWTDIIAWMSLPEPYIEG